MKTLHILVTAGLILMLGAGCRPEKKVKRRYPSLDGGTYVPRKECNTPSFNCYEKCAQRQASSMSCGGCCFDQRRLCDTLQPYNFESCDSAP